MKLHYNAMQQITTKTFYLVTYYRNIFNCKIYIPRNIYYAINMKMCNIGKFFAVLKNGQANDMMDLLGFCRTLRGLNGVQLKLSL